MTVLVFDQETEETLKKLKEFAEREENQIEYDALIKMLEGKAAPIGDNPDYICHLNLNYRCVFSIEKQKHGLCRHLSVSIEKEERYPPQPAVEEIMDRLGFKGNVNDQLNVWIDKETQSVNVLGEFG